MPAEIGTHEVERTVVRAVKRLLDEEVELLRTGANERAITHRLAAHLEREFHGWHVAREYNRQGRALKRVVLERGARTLDNDADRAAVVPDAIVHRRGTGMNLLVIEGEEDRRNSRPRVRQAETGRLPRAASVPRRGRRVALHWDGNCWCNRGVWELPRRGTLAIRVALGACSPRALVVRLVRLAAAAQAS